MAWLRFGDDWNRRPEIRALDDASYRAFVCLIEAAEAFDACGLVTDDYAMTTYPHARQKLRSQVRKLADRGLVHLLSGPVDRDHDCVSCLTRWEELREKWGTSSSTSSGFSKTEPMWFCVRNFFDVALTPERKRNTKQGNAKRQRTKRQKDKAAESRRDADPLSRHPVPDPVPELRDHDHLIAPKEPRPLSTANPSTPCGVTDGLDARSKLRREYEQRWQQTYPAKKPIRWNAQQLGHFDEMQRLAEQEPGDLLATLAVAFDGFFADNDQQKYHHVPQGLVMHWNRYVGDYRQQAEAEERQRRSAAAERRHQEAKTAAEAEHARGVAERLRQREQNGRGSSSGKPLAGDVADLLRSIGAKAD